MTARPHDKQAGEHIIRRAKGVIDALQRQMATETEPWLTPASLTVLAQQNLELVAELERLRGALALIANEPKAATRAYYNLDKLREGDPMRGLPTTVKNCRDIACAALASAQQERT